MQLTGLTMHFTPGPSLPRPHDRFTESTILEEDYEQGVGYFQVHSYNLCKWGFMSYEK